jgi:hypothetical protein
MTVSAVQRHHDGTIRALDRDGWFELRAGDAVDFGEGIVLSVDGPSEMGGGSALLCFLAVLLGVGSLAVGAVVHFVHLSGGGS